MKAIFGSIIGWIKKHATLLKILFFGSILVFVANQVINIAHGLSWQEVGEILQAQDPTSLLLMGGLGIVGLLPMLGYDWVTVRTLETAGKPRMPRGQWFVSAWIVNTINNLAGFGGLVGASLRSNFYREGTKKRHVLATVSKVALFMFSGLSLWALFLTMEILVLGHNPHFRSYWIWLVGGSLYGPLLLIFSYMRRNTLFQELFPKGVLQLVLTSFCQWSGALCVFLGIGQLMQIHLPVTEVYPMFLIATLIGMLTMVPGGMGTFDVMMILGLGQLGLSQSQTVVWLLFYRLFYYLIPFLSGVLLFLSRTSVKINRYFDDLPRITLQKLAHMVVVAAVYFAGIMMVLLSTVTNLSNISQFFRVLYPFSFDFLDQTLNLLVGFLLLGLARGLYAKVKKAYVPTIAVLLFGIVNTVSRTQSPRLIITYCVVLMIVWLSRKEFYREKFVYSWGGLLTDGLLFGTLVVVYGVAGVHSGEWWNNQVLGGRFILFPSSDIWLSGLLGLVVAAVILLSLQKYLSVTAAQLGEALDEERLTALLQKKGGTFSSHRLFLPGYRYFYYQEEGQDQVVFGYQVKGDRCFVLGDPVGAPQVWRQATIAFMQAADKLGYQLAFYRVTDRYVVLLHDLGFHFSKVGESGIVSLQSELDFGQNAHKFSYQGYHFTYYDQLPAELWPDIASISQAWLAGHSEKYFAAGRFDEAYLRRSGVGVVRNAHNKIVGFITQQPISTTWVSYDLLRVAPDAPKELNNYLILQMLQVWRKAGFLQADLGMAPLANVGEGPTAFFRDRLLNLVYTYGQPFYDFQDNFEGKSQVVEKWQGNYFAYLKGGSFYLAAWQLLALMGRGKNKGPTLVEEVILESIEE